MYVPLHAHSSIGSIKDSILDIKEYVKRASEYRLTHLALTDHGSMGGIVDFVAECYKYNITPIVGMEVYVCADRSKKTKDDCNYSHLVLLAKNKTGIKNLFKIHNDAYLNGFYYKPRTDNNFLSTHSNGIIGLSACIGGDIPKFLLSDNYDDAINLTNFYKTIFDDFFLEIQPGVFAEQINANARIIQLASMTNTGIVITNDIHYLNKDDYRKHDCYVKSFRKNVDVKNDAMIYPDTCYYFMSEDEIRRRFNYLYKETIDRCFENINYICSSVNVEKINWGFRMPKFLKTPDGLTEDEYISKLCITELSSKLNAISNPTEYMDRLIYELDVIKELGFSGYFLIIWDLLNFARKNNIAVGPGRGSCGGSIVSWLLNITVADPIKYNLMFERFLSVTRKDLPDIDLDISSDKRHLMLQYTIDTYGRDNCALVGAYGVGKPKSALRTAGRILNIDNSVVDSICKLIPNGPSSPVSIDDAIKQKKKLQTYSNEYEELFNIARNLEKHPTNLGVHAAGIVISPDSLLNKMPLRKYEDKDGNIQMNVSLLTKNNIENVALKFDYLALNTIKLIDDTKKQSGVNIDLSDDSFYNDDKVWNIIGSKCTDGIFQLSSPLYKSRMEKLKPRNIKDLAACLALIRTPCIMSGMDEKYIRVKNNIEPLEKICYEYDSVVSNTYGICIYQEQLIRMCENFGFTKDEANDIRKACSKKIPEKMLQYEKKFKSYVAKKGYGNDIQERLFKIVLDSSFYSFNQAHAVCYAIISYESAWLKVHCREYFIANLLTNMYENQKKAQLESFVNECNNEITFLPIDINKSNWGFTVEGDKIRVGFCAITGLGESATSEIISKRPFMSIEDMNDKINGSKVKRNNFISLILSGGFRYFFTSIKEAYDNYCTLKNIPIDYNYSLNKTSNVKFNIIRSSEDSINYKLLGAKYNYSVI